jgi:eukaryotic-like serine/threonine-protein kinase
VVRRRSAIAGLESFNVADSSSPYGDALGQLTQGQRYLIARTAREFERTRTWVDFDTLADEAAEADEDPVTNEAFRLPSAIGGVWNSESVSLTALGILISGTAPHTSELLAGLARICGKRRLQLKRDATLSSKILISEYQWTTEDASGAGELLSMIPGTPVSTDSSGEWSVRISRDASAYRKVETPDDLQLVLEERAAEQRRLQDGSMAHVWEAQSRASDESSSGAQVDSTPTNAASTATEQPYVLVGQDRTWVLGDQLGKGGFGKVIAAVDANGFEAAAKVVPKMPGAERELLFVDLPDVRNVVPVIHQGETDSDWILIMPKASGSLRERMVKRVTEPLDLSEIVAILTDVIEALCDLDGRVVHRDLKPENVLHLDGHWCIADFGISRYAEATTAPDTRKYALSPPYAAPERWRNERATSATDIYSFGVMAYELISYELPFAGPSLEEFREQHLHAVPAEPIGAPTALIAVVHECLYRSAAARPRPANVLERLGRVASPPVLEGLARLQEVNRAEVDRRGAAAVAASRSQSEEERRRELADDAALALERMSISLKDSILNAAASTVEVAGVTPGFSYQALLDWELQMNAAKIGLSKSAMVSIGAWQGRPVPFDVIASADLTIRIPSDRSGYEGRSHSLWFCDARAVNEYGWFETAFMVHPLV